MGFPLTRLVTEEFPPHRLYMPDIRLRRDPLSEPPSIEMPYTPLLTDVVAQGEDMVRNANAHWAMAFPSRSHAGQRSPDRFWGSRGSALAVPEHRGGALASLSI